MTCRDIAEFLMQYTDGELPWRQRAVFKLHLAFCAACRTYLRSYQLTVELARLAERPDDAPLPATVPDDLVQAILASRPRPA